MKMKNYILEYINSTARQIRLLLVIFFVVSFIFISGAHATSNFVEINVSSASQVKPGGTLSIWVTISNLNIENKSINFDAVEFENPFKKVNKQEAKVDKKEYKQIGKTLTPVGGAKREKEELKPEFFSRAKTKNFTLNEMKIYADKEKQLKKKISQGVKTERIDITVPNDIQEGQTFSIPVIVLLSESGAVSTQSVTAQSVERQITFTVTSNPEPRKAVLIIVDGARADKLYQVAADNPSGNLSWMINNGVKFVNAVNVFPTITVVNHPSILTGTYPGKHGIASAGVFDKNTHEYTDYYGLWDSLIRDAVNNDLQVNTIYEDMPPPMISRVFTEFVDRGATTSDLSVSAVISWGTCKGTGFLCKEGDADVIDDILDNTIWPDNRNFNLTVIWLAGNDIWSHRMGPDSTTEVLNNVDVQIGRLKDFYGQAIVDETIFVVTSDHGQTGVNSNRNIDSDQFANVLEANGYYENTLGINSEHDYYVGGDGGGSEEIYIQSNLVLNDSSSLDGTWGALPRWEDIQPAGHAFYSQAYVDNVLIRYQNSNGYRVYKEYADGTPYTLSLADYFNGRSEYVDAVNRISKLDSERSGDLILLANYSGGYYFESHSYLGDHGNLNPEDSYVPLIISGPGIRRGTLTSASTVDIAPTIANLLGFSMPNANGIVLPVQDSLAENIVINEVYYDDIIQSNAKWDYEWIELYNPTNAEIDTGGWRIETKSYSGAIRNFTIPYGYPTKIAPKSYFVIADSENGFFERYSIAPSFVYHNSTNSSLGPGKNPVCLRLHNTGASLSILNENNELVDRIEWGLGEEGDLNKNDNAPDCEPGYSLQRIISGFDSGNSSHDFSCNFPTPFS